ncbi:low molecular weight phosphotyrosine protein phosphatase [Photobacterium carnosum]|uniref:arsenate reductase/protein-tyrosine-phosphatase family protein n=1 Tax=Photobacterium carnosum TaxID=2023717 RepID=UPI001E38EF82|nr:low molecular weight phosphotyrosine protein phosphatase [Photobacterium carnosum]MCD9526035.1 low molecular weight phosphotyrosine protein phosphatase [Photobacterium carnosum]
MFKNILIVCVGNICRSPFGERLLQIKLPHKHIASAGIATAKSGLSGKSADGMACIVAESYGYSLEGHQAQQLSRELCLNYDLILVMEKGHIDAVLSIAPEVRGKIMLFSQWIDQQDIPDPYRQSKEAFIYVYELIEHAADAWVKKL